MRLLLFIALFAIAGYTMPTPADAGEVVACGAPEEYNMDTTPRDDNYCNLHDRRFAYRERQMVLKDQIAERAKNFNNVRSAAVNQYEENWQALNERRGSDMVADAENAPEQYDEMMGPMPQAENDAQAKIDPDLNGTPDLLNQPAEVQ